MQTVLAITWKKYSTKQKLCYNIICNALCLINYTVLIFSSLYWQIFFFCIFGNLCQSLAFFGNSWPSLSMFGHQFFAIFDIYEDIRQAIYGDLWPSLAIFGDFWNPLAIIGDLWWSLAIFGDRWRSLAIFGNLRWS